MTCLRCAYQEPYLDSIWCANCLYEVCCVNYPAVNTDGTVSMCVHGGRNGTIATYLKK